MNQPFAETEGARLPSEADTCRRYVVPRLQAAAWDTEPHAIREQHTFTDGRIVVTGKRIKRKPRKRVDYLLCYRRDFPIAVVEAKAEYKKPGDGLQQAVDYAEALDLKFAYSTNGAGIVEFDYLTGHERELTAFPTPDELFQRLRGGARLDDAALPGLLEPYNLAGGKVPRYYQHVAIQRALTALLQGQRRVLLTMATGTGKTNVAFQICWKLTQAKWNRTGEARRPRILYLADRNILIDDPKDRTFAAFAEARWKIENGNALKSREMYFAIYQALAKDERRPGLYREYAPEFFDLIIVDECHRGSANAESNWREILEYFEPAYQLGMTATPKRRDNVDTYLYFGNPVYTYSLRQGIDDGFLAPYRVHRVITTWDAAGWRPSQGDLDRYGRPIPDEEYQTRDFERAVSLRARTQAVARHLSDFLRVHGRLDKTIVFCVDQEHADEMRRALVNLNSDLVRLYPDYACRVTSDEGDLGRGHFDRFKDIETQSPVILTTSQLLTTGIDAPTCKNIVLLRVINSMVEFKQIIGRGTRVFEDAGKFYFSILDYTGSATRAFADPEFDGDPALITQEEIDAAGQTQGEETEVEPETEDEDQPGDTIIEDVPLDGDPEARRTKLYFDGGHVDIATHLVYELNGDGKQLRVVKLTDFTAEKVRTLYPSDTDLRRRWADPGERPKLIAELEEKGVAFEPLAEATGRADVDGFDLLCHLAYNAPLRTRRERADRLRREKKDFFEQYGPKAREVLHELLEKYAEHGVEQFGLPDVLKVPPISGHGNVNEIIAFFGGADRLREAVNQMQAELYAA